MRTLRDEDGNELRRDRDGEMVKVVEPDPDRTPVYEADDPCAEHTRFGYRALKCPDCWSEINAGERPLWFLGRPFPVRETSEAISRSSGVPDVC